MQKLSTVGATFIVSLSLSCHVRVWFYFDITLNMADEKGS